MTATLTSTDIDNDRCPKCGAPIAGDTSLVCIPHVQHEALMAAVKTLPWSRSMLEAMMVQMHSWDNEPTVNVRGQMQRVDKVLTALRAAGIDLSEPIKAEEQR